MVTRAKSSWLVKIILGVAALLTISVAAATPTFLEYIEVDQGPVSLADLVHPGFVPPPEWATQVITTAPRPGETGTVTAAQVKLRLRQVDVDPETAELQIPSRILLKARGQEVDSAAVKVEFQRQLLETINHPVTHFEIELVGWPDRLIVPPGNVAIVVTEESDRLRESLFRSYASFGYQIQVDGVEYTSGRARARIAATTEVPVLLRDLQRHQVVTGDDLVLKEVSLTQIRPGTFTTYAEVVGYRTTRLIRSGLPLDRSALEVPPVVPYNGRVRLIAEYNGVYVETPGKALMDGGLGDIIKVENIATRRVVSAQVVGPNEVQALL